MSKFKLEVGKTYETENGRIRARCVDVNYMIGEETRAVLIGRLPGAPDEHLMPRTMDGTYPGAPAFVREVLTPVKKYVRVYKNGTIGNILFDTRAQAEDRLPGAIDNYTVVEVDINPVPESK